MAGHDIVVMGASAGGLSPTQRVLSALPRGFAASIFVVIHTAAETPGLLPDIIGRMSSLPAKYARDGDRIEKGRIYIAPPDRHLLVDAGAVRVTAGPRVNRHRPAIDPLFRSAARAYDSRVVAILFSGLLDDGTSGLKAVSRSGGVTIVQDPKQARFAAMPENAVRHDSPQYVLPVEGIAATLIRLVGDGIRPKRGLNMVPRRKSKSNLMKLDLAMADPGKPGPPSAYVCPECNGTLFEIKEGDQTYFRCRVGHAYGPQSLLVSKGEEMEEALWTAMRTLEEKSALYRRMGESAHRRHNSAISKRFWQSADDMLRQAKIIRDLLRKQESAPLAENEA